jgi:hypothetical protein
MPTHRLWGAMLLLAMASFMTYATESVAQFPYEFRTIDGSENNPDHPHWGRAGTE